MNWIIEQTGFCPEHIADNGNRFLIGNGYMGIRGTLDEFTKEQLTAVNLAGIYDQVGDRWCEPLNAPNPLYTYITAQEERISLPDTTPESHTQSLDFRRGVMSRSTVWEHHGIHITLESQRHASMADGHVAILRFQVCASEPAEITVHAGIDGDVWDISGPHYQNVDLGITEDDILTCAASTAEGKQVAVCRKNYVLGDDPCNKTFSKSPLQSDQALFVKLNAREKKTIISLCCVYTSHDTADPLSEAIRKARSFDHDQEYSYLLDQRHSEFHFPGSEWRWGQIWLGSQVEIEGDARAEQALNYSLYHLNCAAPRDGRPVSVPARGLSGQTYKGAIFWDAEIFMLDYFLLTQPDIARGFINYRIETLPGAIEKAKHYGFEGAFYAWESQENGSDACSDYNVTDVFTSLPVRTYFRDKQIHISGAVAYAIMRYVAYTGDIEILRDGCRVIVECARFFCRYANASSAHDRFELRDVLGPDEYHERVNNNAYTNKIAARTAQYAIQSAGILKEKYPDAYAELDHSYHFDSLLPKFLEFTEKLVQKEPDPNGLIEQFDGYFDLEDASLDEIRSRIRHPKEYWGGQKGVASGTQIIKQADVIACLSIFPEDYSDPVVAANFDYYVPRCEHGSSLSACLYGLAACRLRRTGEAYQYFMKSAEAEIRGGGKQWAGDVYIGGTHPAAAGGAWKVMAFGFAGMHLNGGNIAFAPCLPDHWKKLTFRFLRGDKINTVVIQDGKWEIK